MNEALQGQWADSLRQIELLHLFKHTVWGAMAAMVGTAFLAGLRLAHRESALLRHFAIQLAAWGAVSGGLALWARARVPLRDLAGAVELDRFAWLNVGLDTGYVLVGAALGIVGWVLSRRLELVGAGAGVLVHGLAHIVLDLQLASAILR